MSNEIYKVTRDEYVGFLHQIKADCMTATEENLLNDRYIKTYSKKTGTHLCTRIIRDDGEEFYFVFNMPEDDERKPAPAIRQMTLETREQVQDFFNALNKIQRGEI